MALGAPAVETTSFMTPPGEATILQQGRRPPAEARLSAPSCCKSLHLNHLVECLGKIQLQPEKRVHHRCTALRRCSRKGMAYSHSRLRKTLAVARIMTGLVFLSVGTFKVSSIEFAKTIFPDFLESGIRGGAVTWIRPVLEWITSYGPARIGVAIGFVELFIGIGLILGLAVGPAALVGMLYSAGLFLAAFDQAPTT